ncbi:MAG: hypothetical protein K6A98_06395 [Prevotella sp.]|nr:hypothetical protein [Prevotella sp.]
MFEAKVYTTAILSLSRMMEETHTARQTVSRFNQQNAASTGRLFLPVDDPRAADVVIGIVDNWVKDTGWVDDCIRQGKHVTLLFSAFQDSNNTIPGEHSEVEAFRESLQGRCRSVAYRNAAELKEKVTETLQAHLRD